MRPTLTVLTALLLAPFTSQHGAERAANAPAPAATVLFVSPAGDDSGLGSEASPLATIQQAQTRVRTLVAGMQADIEVRLLPGVYFLTQPLAFTERDGGTGGFVVRYRSHGLPGEARIIYGQVVTGWTPWRDGIVTLQVGTQPFLSLYENDRRATLARQPNKIFDADYPCWDGPYYTSENADVTTDSNYRGSWIQYNRNEFDPASVPLGKMKLMLFPWGNRDWTKSMEPVREIQSDNTKIIFNNRLPLGSTEENSVSNRFYYCDSLNLLDAPGEYFHDTASGVLYYKPFTDASRARIIRPLGWELMSVKGGGVANPARNIVFEGLRFEYGDLGTGSAPGDDFRQMVTVENASGITFSRCVFSLGRTGLMSRRSRDIRVESCLFRKMGVSGVVFNECTDSRIADCRFEEVATTLLYGYGIYLKSCVNSVVEHSEVCDSARYGLSLRGNVMVQKGTNPDNYFPDISPAKDNRIRYLKIMHGGQDSGDMGVLHMAAVNLTTHLNINYVEQVTIANSWAPEGLTDPDRPWGLYVDWVDNSMHQRFSNVQLERVQNMETYTGPYSSHKRSAYFNGANNRLSAVLDNNSFTNVAGGSLENANFARSLMEYGRLGIRSIPPAFLRRACIAHWAFDEADGKVLRQSVPNHVFDGSRLDADWGGPQAVARVAGLTGSALRFGNAADTVATAQRVNAMLDFSILCWVRSPADPEGASATIWSTSQRGTGSGLFCQYVVADGKPGIAFEVEAGRTAVAPLAVQDNAWHLVAAVKEADTVRFYVDGREVAESVLTGPLRTGEFRLGKHPLHPDGAFRGDLDEVRVYNYAVTPDMLRLMESSGRTGSVSQGFILANARSELALEEVADGVVRAVERRQPEDGQVWLRENPVDGRFQLRNLRSGRYLIGREDGQVTTAHEGGAGWTQIPGASPDGLESVRLQGGSLFLSTDNPVFGGAVSMVNQPAEANQEWLLLPAPLAAVHAVLPNPGRLVNLSVRTKAGTAARTLIVGFVVAGSPDQPLLLRGIGPGLAPFGVPGVLADPSLQLFAGPTLLATNDNWSSPASGTAASVAAAFAAAGAFPLPANSSDAALMRPLGAGSYSVQLVGTSATSGVALAEIYDRSSTASGRLANLSARADVGVGAESLIVGFIIAGQAPLPVLVRGIGPTLGTVFGVAGALANPRLELFRGATLAESNDDWGGSTALAAAFARVGAFALAADSRDAALLVTLAPGSYTAQTTGVGGTTGVALVEVYAMP